MSFLGANRNIIQHLILAGLYAALVPWMQGGKWGDEGILPPMELLAGLLLLAVEPWAVRNVMAVELGHLQTELPSGWQWFQKTQYFQLLMFMAVVWRTYFRAVIIVFPLLNGLYGMVHWPQVSAYWYMKVPHALVTGILLYRELRLQLYMFEPPTQPVSAVQEWASRGVILLLTTIFMQTASQLAHDFMGSANGAAIEVIRNNLLFLAIYFTFFYVPLRWIELLSGAVDSRTRWQAVAFWASAFGYMLFALVYK